MPGYSGDQSSSLSLTGTFLVIIFQRGLTSLPWSSMGSLKHTSPLVMSKTKVAPIKRLTIPRLELCGADLLAQLLCHVKRMLNLPPNCVYMYVWTDSTVFLSWLVGNPRHFKTYVGNRVSCIMELIALDRWKHVNGIENPADCASRGLFPSELLGHDLWWNGPTYM